MDKGLGSNWCRALKLNAALLFLVACSLLLNFVNYFHGGALRFDRNFIGGVNPEYWMERGSRVEFNASTTVLVTGAAGFIGMHTILHLVSPRELGGMGLAPSQVVGVDNYENYYSVKLKKARTAKLGQAGVPVKEASLCDEEAMRRLFESHSFTHVIHLAAQPGIRFGRRRPDKYITNNLQCFDVIIETILKFAPHAYLVYASSSSVYGGNTKVPFSEQDPVDLPLSLYGATKRANELLAYSYFSSSGLHSTGLRFFTVYGEWGRPDMAMYKFLYSIEHNKSVKLFDNGHSARDFTYVGDIVRGIIAACEFRAPADIRTGVPSSGVPRPEIFNLGNNEPVEVGHLVRILEKELGTPALVTNGGSNSDEVATTHSDTSKAAMLLGWKSHTSIQEGVKRFAAWYRSESRPEYFEEGEFHISDSTNKATIATSRKQQASTSSISDKITRLESTNLNAKDHHSPILANNGAVIEMARHISSNSPYARPWTIIMLVNNAMLPMALNWICHASNRGLNNVLKSTLFVSMDAHTHNVLKSQNRSTVLWLDGEGWNTSRTFGTVEYFTLISMRQGLVLDLLNNGISILVAEPDATWFGDVVEYVESEQDFSDADAVAYNDNINPKTASTPCGGLLFLRPTNATKELMKALIAGHQKGMKELKGLQGEQIILKIVWNSTPGSFLMLPIEKFASGNWYKKSTRKEDGLLYLHANWVKGIGNKIHMMRKNRHWFLDQNSVCHKEAVQNATVSKSA